MILGLAVSLSSGFAFVAAQGSDLVVQTNHFTVRGVVEANTSDSVRVFRRIPYAEPPLGIHRFKPPVTKKPESAIVDATKFGESCTQLNNGLPTAYTVYLPGFLLAPGATTGEDCLSLVLWAPRAKANQSLPVIVYIPGGGFTGGGANSQYKYGGPIVRDNQDVIVISINYRLNIFGYPNAASLKGHNLNPGLLDQRKAIEWVYDNIAAFGGDPERITLWGQSAGASSVDKYTYAWADDPIVQGFIMDSGVATLLGKSAADTSNFTYVASQVNCTQKDPDAVFACMQQKNASDIIAVLDTYNATQNGGNGLSFVPAGDNETNFDSYTALQAQGKFARLPVLIGNNNNEFATLAPYSPNGPNETVVQQSTALAMTCPAGRAAQARRNWSLPAWRYRYFGEFPNLNPVAWLGAYHSSELPLVFGTSNLLGPNTALENRTSHYMQQAWLAFARDPQQGLAKYGWPLYNGSTKSLVELGYQNDSSAVMGGAFDQSCS